MEISGKMLRERESSVTDRYFNKKANSKSKTENSNGKVGTNIEMN